MSEMFLQEDVLAINLLFVSLVILRFFPLFYVAPNSSAIQNNSKDLGKLHIGFFIQATTVGWTLYIETFAKCIDNTKKKKIW